MIVISRYCENNQFKSSDIKCHYLTTTERISKSLKNIIVYRREILSGPKVLSCIV